MSYLAVWGLEPVMTRETSWLESTGLSVDYKHLEVKCSAVLTTNP